MTPSTTAQERPIVNNLYHVSLFDSENLYTSPSVRHAALSCVQCGSTPRSGPRARALRTLSCVSLHHTPHTHQARRDPTRHRSSRTNGARPRSSPSSPLPSHALSSNADSAHRMLRALHSLSSSVPSHTHTHTRANTCTHARTHTRGASSLARDLSSLLWHQLQLIIAHRRPTSALFSANTHGVSPQ